METLREVIEAGARAEERDRCDRCGGDLPPEDRMDDFDDQLTRGGDCPGYVAMDATGRVVGCGAWEAAVYAEIARDAD